MRNEWKHRYQERMLRTKVKVKQSHNTPMEAQGGEAV
jgi:hypothetical protein